MEALNLPIEYFGSLKEHSNALSQAPKDLNEVEIFQLWKIHYFQLWKWPPLVSYCIICDKPWFSTCGKKEQCIFSKGLKSLTSSNKEFSGDTQNNKI